MAKKFRDENDKLIKAKRLASFAMAATTAIIESIAITVGGVVAPSASGPTVASESLSYDKFTQTQLYDDWGPIGSRLWKRFDFKASLYKNRAKYNEKIEKMSDEEKIAAYEKQVLIEKDYAKVPKIFKKALKKYEKDKISKEEFNHTKKMCQYVLHNYITFADAEQKIIDEENKKRAEQLRSEREKIEREKRFKREMREKEEKLKLCTQRFDSVEDFKRYLSKEDFEVKLAVDNRHGGNGGVLKTIKCTEHICVRALFVDSAGEWTREECFFKPGDVVYFDAPGFNSFGKLENVRYVYVQKEKEQTEKKKDSSKENVEESVKEK